MFSSSRRAAGRESTKTVSASLFRVELHEAGTEGPESYTTEQVVGGTQSGLQKELRSLRRAFLKNKRDSKCTCRKNQQ